MSDAFKRTFVELHASETDEGRGYWMAQPWVAEGQRSELLAAQILVVPILDSDKKPVFPIGTPDIVDFLRRAITEPSAVAVAISADDYQELALHSKAWRIPKLVITAVAFPIFLGIITNRLDEFLPGHKAEDTAEIEIVIEAPDHRAMKITYKGDPKEMAKYINEATKKFIESTSEQPPPSKPKIASPKP